MSVCYLYHCARCREAFVGSAVTVLVDGNYRWMCDYCAMTTEDEKYRAAMDFFAALSDEEAEA